MFECFIGKYVVRLELYRGLLRRGCGLSHEAKQTSEMTNTIVACNGLDITRFRIRK